MMRETRFAGRVVAAVALWVAAACAPDPDHQLPGSAASLDELAERFVAAVAARDTAAMHALRLSEHEHNTLLWPHLPAAQPDRNMPVAFAWANLDRRSRRDARRIVASRGGTPWTFEAVTCREAPVTYGPATVHGDCWVTVRRADRTRHAEKFFGSAVRLGGGYKAVGIVED